MTRLRHCSSVASVSATARMTSALFLLTLGFAGVSTGQTAERQLPTQLINPSFEEQTGDAQPVGWLFRTRNQDQQSLTLDTDSVDGDLSAQIDATKGANAIANLMQVLDATPWRGQRIRYSAAVRTDDLAVGSQVQLWCRVDASSGMAAFDNMQDRPIDSSEWQRFEIVLDVAENATTINLGMFVLGNGRAAIDAARLEVADAEIETTGRNLGAAFAAAANAPPQPFWTPWLLLATLGCLLMLIAQRPKLETDVSPSLLEFFSLRFCLIYWLLYSLPQPFGGLIPKALSAPVESYAAATDTLVRWTARTVFGKEDLIAPNGSGDTTYAYVSLFSGFVLASLGAALWTALRARKGTRERRVHVHRVTHDLLRSYLRYVLAITMLSYGMAKVGAIGNQFPVPGDGQLGRTYADSSPMGLLWTFMGASRPYTYFAGLGELVGGLLLFFRRTTAMGALVVFGVMLNVMMLNFAYDVPVKQYSAHLVWMAILLLMPDAKRLLDVLFLHGGTRPSSLQPPYRSRRVLLARRVAKPLLLLLLAVVPLSRHAWREVQHARSNASESTPASDTLLLGRGFRWINEVPFNR